MKLLFFLSGVLCISLSVLAQSNMEDVVYLKNGSKIKGTILLFVPDSMVSIEQAGGSVWVFPVKEIAMMAKEERSKYRTNISQAKGYRFAIDAGILMGSGDNQNNAPLSLQMLHSFHITPSVSAGIGAGLEFFQTTQALLFADIRYYFSRKYYAPFFFLEGGALLPAGSQKADFYGYSYKGQTGWMLNSGLGFLFPMNENTALAFSLSYRYQELKFHRDNDQLPDYMRIEKMNRLNVRFGLILQ